MDIKKKFNHRGIEKTGIVCTIGPSTNNVTMLADLMKEGMKVIRMNFSHGDHPVSQQKRTQREIERDRERNNACSNHLSLIELSHRAMSFRTVLFCHALFCCFFFF